MNKKTLSPTLVLALLVALAASLGGAVWAAQPTSPAAGVEEAPVVEQGGTEAPTPQVLPLAPVLETLPMAHGGGYCATTHTDTVTQCEEYCYFNSTCGFHHWDALTCTCYCGGDLI